MLCCLNNKNCCPNDITKHTLNFDQSLAISRMVKIFVVVVVVVEVSKQADCEV